jgi:CNT family concentrative nucleoside transporter
MPSPGRAQESEVPPVRGLEPGPAEVADQAGADAQTEAPAAPTQAGTADGAAEDTGRDAQPAADAAPAIDASEEPGAGARAPIELRQLRPEPVPWHQRALSFAGIFVMVAIGWALSDRRDRFPARVVAWGIGLQLVFGILVLKTPAGMRFFAFLNDVVARLLEFTEDGSRFLFGRYLDQEFTVALRVLPTIIFFSALMSVLYHVGAMQRVVHAVAWVMHRTLRTSGAETLSAAGNIFLGQTEAPLLVKPFVGTMTRSEIMSVMTGGFATVAGGVLAAYVGMLSGYFPDIAGHLIAASVMSAPAALLVAKVMVPETETPETASSLSMSLERPHANLIDAAAGGAADGLKLALNVGAMLLAFLALVAMVNYALGLPALWHNQATWDSLLAAMREGSQGVPSGCDSPDGAQALAQCIERASSLVEGTYDAWTPWSLERILGLFFWPIAFVMGVPIEDCAEVATLLGQRTVLNEFVAYVSLAQQLGEGASIGHRAVTIATYALCGFANFGSIAIQIGGIGGIAPERRGDIARLGMRAMIAGTLASLMTACVAGVLV